MPKQGITVRVDPRRCVANAKCTAAAPGIYEIDEETGVAFLADSDNATVAQIFAGARACPTQAIIVEQYGNRVFPQILTPMWGDKPGGDAAEEPSGRTSDADEHRHGDADDAAPTTLNA